MRLVMRAALAAGALSFAALPVCAGLSSAAPTAPAVSGHVTGNHVRVHEDISPGVPGKTIGWVNSDSQINIECLHNNGTSGMWYRISGHGVAGLAKSDFITPDVNPPMCYEPAPVTPM